MTKEQVQEEYIALLKKRMQEEERIIKEAKEQGRWRSGLDANQDLFLELNQEFAKKVELLKSMVD